MNKESKKSLIYGLIGITLIILSRSGLFTKYRDIPGYNMQIGAYVENTNITYPLLIAGIALLIFSTFIYLKLKKSSINLKNIFEKLIPKSKSFEKNTATDQSIKPNSIKSIILSTLLLAAFFMPWIKVFGFGGSAFDLIKEVVKNIKLLDKEPMGILLFLLLLFPICSLIIIVNYSKSQLKFSQINALKFAKKTPLVLILITIIVTIIKLPKGSGNFKFEDLGNIFEIMGIGLIITLITSIILFFDKTATISKFDNEINLKKTTTTNKS